MTRTFLLRAAGTLAVAGTAGSAAVAACETPTLPPDNVCVVGMMEIGSIPIQPSAGSTPCSNAAVGPQGATLEVSGEAGLDGSQVEADVSHADGAAFDAHFDAGPMDGTGPTDGSAASDGGSDVNSLDADAGVAPTIAAGTTNLSFLAQAFAPPGTWQLNVTAAGALAIGPFGADGGVPGTFSQTFMSIGGDAGTSIQVPIVSSPAAYGLATITTSLGASTQDFFFTVLQAPPSPRAPSCIQSTQVRVLAWAELPPPPPPPSNLDACTFVTDAADDPSCPLPEAGPSVPTLIVDVLLTLVDCDTDSGVADMVVSVMGTGGLEPTLPTFMTDSAGKGSFELRGPFLLDQATAVLACGTGTTTVCVMRDASCPDD